MNKTVFTIVLLFLGAVALFAVYNDQAIELTVPFSKTYQIPKIGLILFSVLSGALFILILFTLRDTRRFISNYQYQKKQKKEERIEALYSRALNDILANDLEAARTPLEEILREEPGHTKALLRLGDIETRAERHGKAAEYYRRALDSSGGKNLEAHLRLAGGMRAMKRREEALTLLDEILERDGDNLSALEMKRSTLEEQAKWPELIENQKDILKHPHLLNKKTEEARIHGYKYEHARASLESGHLERAAKLFRSILKYDAGFIPAYLGAAEVLLRQDESAGAVEFLEKGYEETGSEIILARLEDLLISLGEPEKIISVYRSALARLEDPRLRYLLAKLYYRLEMVEDSFEALRALEASESYPVIYSLRGELFMRRENYEDAARNFRRAIETKPWKLYYNCRTCGHVEDNWSGRCPNCGRWSTFSFSINGKCGI